MAWEAPSVAVGAGNTSAVLPTTSASGDSSSEITSYSETQWSGNDDGTYPGTVALGFQINFFGGSYSSLYVNNNGNVTFSAPLSQFTPSQITTFGSPIIAPFFADVDTRVGSVVNFGTGMLDGHKAFVVNWPGVGCYNQNDSVTDDFQLVLVDRPDRGGGATGDDFDIEFNYGHMAWDTGEASGGNSSCQANPSGTSAYVGFSNGTDGSGDSFEQTGSGVHGAFIDGGPDALFGQGLTFPVTNGQPNTAPQNTSAPTITGTAQVGDTLSVDSSGTWSGVPTVTDGDLSYQWQDCSTATPDPAPSSCADISGANSSSYVLAGTDAGSFVRVVVTANNGVGTPGQASSDPSAVVGEEPANVSAPTITGTPQVGDTLSVESTGTWSGYPDPSGNDFSYQWQDCSSATPDPAPSSCADISGANSSSYVLAGTDAGSFVRVVVTADNNVGTAGQASSAPSTAVDEEPANSSAPTITGTPQVGDALSVESTGTWSGYPVPSGNDFSYQWQDCSSATPDPAPSSCADISGANSSSYVLAGTDAGSFVRVVVTANNGVGTPGRASSDPSAVVGEEPANVSAPTITGTAQVGDTLSVDSSGTWSGVPTVTDGDLSYQWQDCSTATPDPAPSSCADISGANSSSYVLAGTDAGSFVRVVVTANNGVGTPGQASSDPSAVVGEEPANVSAPTITGTPQVGDTLSVESTGTWSGYPDPSGNDFSYQWQDCSSATPDPAPSSCADISGANSSSYVLAGTDAGSFVRVVVTADNNVGTAGQASSAPSTAVDEEPANSSAPTITGTPQVGDALSVESTGTWSGYPVPSGNDFSYQWQDCSSATPASDPTACQNINGANSDSYVLAESDAGLFVRVVVTADNNVGTPAEASSDPRTQVQGPAINSSAPTITGTALVGDALSVDSNGTWTGPPVPTGSEFTYQWQDCSSATPNPAPSSCADITGALSSSYVLGVGDEGEFVRVVVTANNGIGASSSASSGPSQQVQGPAANISAPTITGTALVGDALTVESTGTWSGYPVPSGSDFSYQWQDCSSASPASDPTACQNINGANSDSYVLTQSDAGLFVRVVVTADNTVGTAGQASSDPSTQVQGAPASTSAPTITGTPQVGDALSVESTGTWSGYPVPSGNDFSYQWQDCSSASPSSNPTACQNITGANSDSYVLAESDAGLFVRVVVTADNNVGTPAEASSDPSTQVQGPAINSSAPTISGTATAGQIAERRLQRDLDRSSGSDRLRVHLPVAGLLERDT